MTGAHRIAMVAGEASGDLLASLLLAGLNLRRPGTASHGIGGPCMIAQGFRADWPMEKLAVRGYVEVLRHYREITGIRRALREQLLAVPPDLFLGVDAPDFNLELETNLRAAGIPTAHFVSPSIWAWRGGRIERIRRAVDHMLVLFPFEAALYREAGIPATYVGHPLADVIPREPDRAGARQALGLAADEEVVAILPGSRLSEIRYVAPTFIEAVALMGKSAPRARFIAPMAGNASAAAFAALLAGRSDADIRMVPGQSHTVLAACDAALVASGTATLETALFKRPMVIAYRMAPLSWFLMKRMKYQPWVGLPNILAGEFLVPEFLQEAATPAALAEATLRQLRDDANRARLTTRFAAMHAELSQDTATRAAAVIGQLLDARRPA